MEVGSEQPLAAKVATIERRWRQVACNPVNERRPPQKRRPPVRSRCPDRQRGRPWCDAWPTLIPRACRREEGS